MLKDTKSLGNNKAPACVKVGALCIKKEVTILTHLPFPDMFALHVQQL